jgi:hypothetical protein
MDGNAATTSHVGILGDLASDHDRMRSLFAQLLAAQEKERCKELFLELQALVTTHAALEERYLYPAFKEAAPTQQERWMFHQVTEEHDAADLTLQKVRKAGYATDAFFGKVCALRDLVEKHAAEEEVELFPLCAHRRQGARVPRAAGAQGPQPPRRQRHAPQDGPQGARPPHADHAAPLAVASGPCGTARGRRREQSDLAGRGATCASLPQAAAGAACCRLRATSAAGRARPGRRRLTRWWP